MSTGFDNFRREASGELTVKGYVKGYGKRTALAAAIALAPGLAGAVDLIAPDILTVDQDYNVQAGTAVSGDNGYGIAVTLAVGVGEPYTHTLTNAGHIEYAGNHPYSIMGLVVGSELNGELINKGSISAERNDEYFFASALAVSLQGGIGSTGILRNEGSIAAVADASHGFFGGAVGVDVSGMEGEFINDSTGHISAFAEGSRANAFGLYVGAASGTFTNAGTITAEALGDNFSTTARAVYIESFSGVFDNFGVLSATAGNGEGYSFSVNGYAGTLNNHAGGVLNGKLSVYGPEMVVKNAGLINLPETGGEEWGDQSVVFGSYLQTATGKLVIGAYGTGQDEHSGLTVFGDVTLEPGATAGVNVLEGNTGATRLAVGETLEGVVYASGLTGNFSKVTDNSALFNFKSIAHYGEGSEDNYIDFEIIEGVTAVKSTRAAGNTMALGAAAVFDGIIGEGDAGGEMQTVIDALGSLETGQEVSDALSQTLPLFSTNLATANALRGTSRVIRERQGLLRGRSSGEGFLGDEQLWMKAFGSWADQDERGGVPGYDADTSGLVLGSDAALSAVDRLGLAFAYARTDLNNDSRVARQSAKVDSFQAMLYGSHDLSEATVLDYQLDAGRHNNEGQRDIDFGGLTRQAEADYSSWSAHLGGALSHSLQWTEQTRFIPALRLDYTWMRDEAYDEKGADALNLEVDDNRTEALILGVDGQLDHALNERLSLSAKVGLGYDLINDQASLTSAFAGAPTASFVTRGLDPSPWVKTAGLGLSYAVNEQTQLSAAYDLEGREDFLNQTASVKVRWAF